MFNFKCLNDYLEIQDLNHFLLPQELSHSLLFSQYLGHHSNGDIEVWKANEWIQIKDFSSFEKLLVDNNSD